jgi:hypothetical protein
MMKAKSKWFKLTMAIVGALLLIGVSSAQAAMVTFEPGTQKAIGIEDLNVGGMLYNVIFPQASAEEIYDPFPGTFTFTTLVTAVEARNAVNLALNDDNATGVGEPGPGSAPAFLYSIAYESDQGIFDGGVGQFVNAAAGIWSDSAATWKSAQPEQWGYLETPVYAQFSPVPVPAAVWLLGGGLIGLLGLRRRFKN